MANSWPLHLSWFYRQVGEQKPVKFFHRINKTAKHSLCCHHVTKPPHALLRVQERKFLRTVDRQKQSNMWKAITWAISIFIMMEWQFYLNQLRTHKGSKEKGFAFRVRGAEALGGGAWTVIGRTHSLLSLPSIRRGCSYLKWKSIRDFRGNDKYTKYRSYNCRTVSIYSIFLSSFKRRV